MPKFTPNQIKQDAPIGDNAPCGPYRAALLSDTGGLTQFGAFIETLPPGSKSSIKHWHALEDELVYMLEGTVTLHEGDQSVPLTPGDTATFKAGAALGHCLENQGNADARYLVIGTRSAGDTVTYPDHNRIGVFNRAAQSKVWTDFAGHPATSAYHVDAD